jgi:hypothetical protein
MKSLIRPLIVWPLLAVLAGAALGCTDDNALYTSDKYVPGYRPRGDTSLAMSHLQARDRDAGADWRQR